MSLYSKTFPRIELGGGGGIRVLRLGWWSALGTPRPWRPRAWTDGMGGGVKAHSVYVPLLGTFSWYAHDDLPDLTPAQIAELLGIGDDPETP